MKAIELIGDIDEQHRLHAQVPKELPTGQIRLIRCLKRTRLVVPGPREWALSGRQNWPIIGKTSTRWMTITR